VFEVNTSTISIVGDSGLFVEKLKGKSVAEHVETSSQGLVGNSSEVKQVCDSLFKIAGVGGIAVVSILLCYEIVGFMRELVLDDVLESKKEQRFYIGKNTDILARFIPKLMLDIVPVLESQRYVVACPAIGCFLCYSTVEIVRILVVGVQNFHDIIVVVCCQDQIS